MSFSREILDRVTRILEYHRVSKPVGGAIAGRQPDPASQPSPYRAFDGYPKINLPDSLLDEPVPAISILADGLSAVPDSQQSPPQDLKTLATWLFMSYGLTGKRQSGNKTIPLRSCPSGGATYPCEIYVAAFSIDGLEAGLYHYSVREHALRKIRSAEEMATILPRVMPHHQSARHLPAAIFVSTIFWRSAWRYNQRGLRMALLDTGHLVENLRLAAVGMGMDVEPHWQPNDSATRQLIGISPDADIALAEAVQAMILWNDQAEWPMGVSRSPEKSKALGNVPRELLSPSAVPQGAILAAHHDCVDPGVPHRDIRWQLNEYSPMPKNFPTRKIVELDAIHDPGGVSLRQVFLSRRSPVDLAMRTIPRDAFGVINQVAFNRTTFSPLDPGAKHAVSIVPFWVINGVSGIDSGIWFFHVPTDSWALLRRGESRKDLQHMSMEQEICGHASAVCLMTVNFYTLTHEAGPDAYRLAHFEAGMIGQRISLAATSLGLAARGIGLFHDDDIRRFLGLDRTHWEIAYEVAVGVTLESVAASDRELAEPKMATDWRG